MTRLTSPSKLHPFIDDYFDYLRSHPASREMLMLEDYVRAKCAPDYVVIDADRIGDAVRLIETYFGLALFPWEKFVIACMHIYDKRDDTVIFDEFFIEMGRGNGKNGFISALIWYLTTPNHGIKGYNIDIVANSEDQATTSFNDVYDLIKEDATGKLRRQFDVKKTVITNTLTNSYIKYNTSNARTKDGKRTACIVFDEVHEYEDWSLINVFKSGFGKRKHSRTFYITTNGFVRYGVLDQQLDLARDVLDGKVKDLGMLPMIYKLDTKDQVASESNWEMANPSLPYLPELRKELRKQFVEMKYRQSAAITFLTKRMNVPAQDTFTTVATPEQVMATNRPIPYDRLKGQPCVGAVDYASVRDFCSVGLLFHMDGLYYLIEHTFVCHLALEIESREIKFPVREMADRGLITILNTDTIKPEVVAGWFLQQAQTYAIQDIFTDDFRRTLLDAAFADTGLPLTSVRSGTVSHSKLSPVIDSIFSEHLLVCGDNPTMRWYINNVKQEMDKRGNISYVKIEPILRKTDGFFMFTHALNGLNLLPSEEEAVVDMMPVTF